MTMSILGDVIRFRSKHLPPWDSDQLAKYYTSMENLVHNTGNILTNNIKIPNRPFWYEYYKQLNYVCAIYCAPLIHTLHADAKFAQLDQL